MGSLFLATVPKGIGARYSVCASLSPPDSCEFTDVCVCVCVWCEAVSFGLQKNAKV